MNEKQLHLFGVDESKNAKKRYTVILPLDTLILLLIVAVLLFTLSFSLGVERGRKIVYLNAEEKPKTAVAAAPLAVVASAPVLKNATAGLTSSALAVPAVTEVVIAVPRKPPEETSVVKIEKKETVKSADVKSANTRTSDSTGRYVIQVASYRGEDSAQREAKKLASKGYPVYTEKKGGFIAVFVGDFQSKQEAQRNAKLLEQTYGQCVVRTRS